MATNADAYRTLGLAPGATLDEVKRAYRRLAKANHPDAAGESALPRFLAIQAAYDRIVDPDGTATRAGNGRATPASPWQADPNRARATHRAYGGRSRRTRSTSGRPNGTGSTTGGPAAGGATADDASPGTDRPPRRWKKATLGSTSYDGAEAEPFEPDWGGASWYGTTSGTYWTLNPKEYADPRKHGPEYQARARRAAEVEAAQEAVGVDDPGAAAGLPPDATAGSPPDAAAGPPPGATQPTHTTGTWWAATDAGAARSAAGEDPATTAAPPLEPTPDPLVEATWLDAGSGSLAGRAARAIAAWAPLALGLGWVVGEASGCGRFAATCDPVTAPLMAIAQLAVLAVLLLVPRLASVGLVGAIGTLIAAVPASFVLASMGGAAEPDGSRAALAVVLVIGWSAGIAVGLVREVRRARRVDRPVS